MHSTLAMSELSERNSSDPLPTWTAPIVSKEPAEDLALTRVVRQSSEGFRPTVRKSLAFASTERRGINLIPG